MLAACYVLACAVMNPHRRPGMATATTAPMMPMDTRASFARSEPGQALVKRQTYPSQLPHGTHNRLLTSTHRLSAAAPLRIKYVWDVVHSGGATCKSHGESGALKGPCEATEATHCSAAGQRIAAYNRETSAWQQYTCVPEDIVGQTDVGLSTRTLVRALEKAAELWGAALSVLPVQDAVSIPLELKQSLNIQNSSADHNHCDLLVIVTVRPEPAQGSIRGSATCWQRDQFYRCTVGVLNVVPKAIATTQTGTSTLDSIFRTAAHEVGHLLGAVSMGPHWIDPSSQRPAHPSEYAMAMGARSTQSERRAILLKSPRLLIVARWFFACSSLAGVPLEDHPLGHGHHWESRVMGPELMAYGRQTGTTFLSPLTLAMLEDTNQFVANYDVAGPIGAQSTLAREATRLHTGNETLALPNTLAEILPGTRLDWPMWGFKAGCDFVKGVRAKNWPAEYTCTQHGLRGCTADRSWTGLCQLSSELNIPWPYSCSEVEEHAVQGSQGGRYALWRSACPQGSPPAHCQNGSCPLPDAFQLFGNNNFSLAPLDASGLRLPSSNLAPERVGGVIAAMDFLPTTLRLSKCAQDDMTAGYSAASQYLQTDSSGQIRCRDCRCFHSTLSESPLGRWTSQSPAASSGCYRSNCFSKELLQVGIHRVETSSMMWFDCPRNGGDLVVPGWAGRLLCPPATRYCETQPLTGNLERTATHEAQWGLLIVIWLALCASCILTCSRRASRFAARQCTRACAVTAFHQRRELLCDPALQDMSRWLWSAAPSVKARVGRYVAWMQGVSTLTAAGALLCFGTGWMHIAHASVVLIVMGLSCMLGILGRRSFSVPAHGAPCGALAFTVSAGTCALALFVGGGILFFAASQPGLAETYARSIGCSYLSSADTVLCGSTSGIRTHSLAGSLVRVLTTAIGLLCCCVGSLLLCSSTTAIRSLPTTPLVPVLACSSWLSLGLSACVLVAAASDALFWRASFWPWHAVAGPTTAMGGFMILGAATGAAGLHARCEVWVVWQTRIACVFGVACCAASVSATSVVQLDTLQRWTSSLTRDEVYEVSHGLGLPVGHSEWLLRHLTQSFRVAGVLSALCAVVCVVCAYTNALFVRELRIFNADRTLRVQREEAMLRELGIQALFSRSRGVFDVLAPRLHISQRTPRPENFGTESQTRASLPELAGVEGMEGLATTMQATRVAHFGGASSVRWVTDGSLSSSCDSGPEAAMELAETLANESLRSETDRLQRSLVLWRAEDRSQPRTLACSINLADESEAAVARILELQRLSRSLPSEQEFLAWRGQPLNALPVTEDAETPTAGVRAGNTNERATRIAVRTSGTA